MPSAQPLDEAPPAAPQITAAAAPTRQEIRRVFLGLMIVLGLASIDQSIVATALPRIVSDLGGLSHLAWVVTAYVLASTAVMPLYGKLSDQYGRKSMVYAAVLLFLLGSALSGFSQTLGQLIAFRAVQGLGAGGLLPLSQIIIGDLIPPAQRGSRQGAVAAVYAACSVIGPVLGGIITDALSWHWIFFVNLPLGAVALYVIAKALHHPTVVKQHRIDYLGALLLTASTTALLFLLTLGGQALPWTSPPIVALALAAALLAIWLVLHLRRAAEPVLPLDLFDDRTFVVACAVLSLAFMGMIGVSIFFPLFFQIVIGVSPAQSGLLTVPLMVGVVVSSVVNGRVLLKSGRYKPAQLFGLTLATCAFAVIAWAAATSRSLYVIEPAVLALGLGLGLVMPNMTIAVQNALPFAHRGVGTATLAWFRSLGALVGVTASGAILSWQLRLGGVDSKEIPRGLDAGHSAAHAVASASQLAASAVYRHAIATTFFAGTFTLALALCVLTLLPEIPLRDHPGPAR